MTGATRTGRGRHGAPVAPQGVCLFLRPSVPRHRGFDRTGEGGIARVTRRGSCEIWPTRAALRPRPSTWAGRLDMSAAVCTKRPLSERLCDKVRYLGATLKQ